MTGLAGESHLAQVTLRDAAGASTTHAIRHVFSMTGAKPNTEPTERSNSPATV